MKFQFLKGAIDIGHGRKNWHRLYQFQFLKGAIDMPNWYIGGPLNNGFNSSKVRLIYPAWYKDGDNAKFQFLKGAIDILPHGRPLALVKVSIPQRCD